MPSIQARMIGANLKIMSALTARRYYSLKFQRYMFSKVVPKLWPAPKGVGLEPLTVDGIPAAWLIPDKADDDRVILYLHGGAFVIGSIESHWKMASRIAAAAGCRALIIDYRLAPEHPFPAGLEDCVSAYRWLLAEGYQPKKIIIAGDSAGGGLTASTLISLRDSKDPLPAAAMMLSPGTDLECTGESFKTKAREDPMITESWARECVGMYLGPTDSRDPLASPLYADLKGLPPMLIQVGTREILLDDSRRFAERAERDGVEVELEVWDGMFHVWQFHIPYMPESRDAVKKLGEYCRGKTVAGTRQ